MNKLLDALGSLSMAGETNSPWVRAAIVVIALTMALLHMLQAATFMLSSDILKAVHLGLSMTLVYLAFHEQAPRDAELRRRLYLVLAALSLVPMFYIYFEYQALVTQRIFGGNVFDVSISVLLVSLALIASTMQWGFLFTSFSVLALIYGAFGYVFSDDLFYHAGIGFTRLTAYAAIPYFQGTLGSMTSLSATLIFLFMLFVGLLKSTGGMDFVMIAGKALAGKSSAGPARLAVVSSGLMGMISGSTVANVASTGAITIRLMKQFGIPGEKAGAIEAVASTGGQFAPPIMGLTAFLIVGMTGIAYSQVMLAAIFPAVIYFGALLFAVQLYANKIAAGAGQDAAAAMAAAIPDMTLLAATRTYGHVLISVVVLVVLMVMLLPAPQSALAAILTLIATETLKQLWRHRRAPLEGLKSAGLSIARGLESGARDGAQLAIIIAVIGILVDILVVTGFAQKLSYVLLSVAGDQLWLLLIMTALACIVFGLGMPTPAAYILVALLGVPALLEFGVPVLAAHMFVFFFANMSAITPPIAVASLVAAKIAQADYLKTAFTSMWLGLPGFILPFVFIDSPQLLGLKGGFAEQLFVFAVAFLAVLAANIAFIGYIARPIAPWQRALVFGAAGGLLFPSNLASAVGAVLLVAALTPELLHFREVRMARRKTSETRR